MNFTGPRVRRSLLLDLTPLIDVVFLLLIFFMVTTTFISQPAGMQVDLPRSESRDTIPEGEDVTLHIDAEGGVAVDDERVDLSALRRKLSQAARDDPSTLVVLRADQEVKHGRVVQVMDLARDLGLRRFAIATDATAAPTTEGAGSP